MSNREEAGAAVQRALLACMGPAAADAAGARPGSAGVGGGDGRRRASSAARSSSRITRVTGGTAHVEASDPMLAQELDAARRRPRVGRERAG